MTVYRGMCMSCARLSDDEETGELFCEAFQGPPPLEIIQDGFDHRQEFPGDNGLRFVPDGPVPQEFIDSFTKPTP